MDQVFGIADRGRLGRVLDVGMVILLLPVFAIPALLVALAVFLDSPGGVLYRTRRVGADGRPFAMLKFRTMRHGSVGPSLTCASDVRITPLGRFLRNSRLDELPQLWNVLRGEMRLVGPRPELQEFVDRYPAEYQEILSVPPGIAGHTQLEFALIENDLLEEEVGNSRYYAEKLMPQKVRLDLEYVRTRSGIGDLRILWRTLMLPMHAAAARLLPALGNQTSRARAAFAFTAGAAVALLIAFLVASGSAR